MRLLESGLGLALVFTLGALLYFLPGIVAYLYRRDRLLYITLLNLFAGWTVIGWFGALTWATVRDSRALEEIAPIPRYETQKKLVVFAGILVLALLIQTARVYLFQDSRSAATTAAVPPKIDPASVSVADYALRKEENESKGDFTVRNSNMFRIKHVVVKCVFATIDANVLGATEVTIERTFDANAERRITDVDLGATPKGTANVSCSTLGFAPAD